MKKRITAGREEGHLTSSKDADRVNPGTQKYKTRNGNCAMYSMVICCGTPRTRSIGVDVVDLPGAHASMTSLPPTYLESCVFANTKASVNIACRQERAVRIIRPLCTRQHASLLLADARYNPRDHWDEHLSAGRSGSSHIAARTQ
jgi:hypothetical protein